ncbi:Phage shock protein PspC (stress-responsive transcriptional regulator) [Saccharopolyspora antimicrobica]|uniref:Phage shock protein C (PspC) family protein n=2 Tax=Saccharopolyspora antimicrobica TaxID=455193 RepID=A0A1I5DA54_9PSEU|nr:phage shock protein C (PspC) family protein [Saccharopolyspora antimicrobica]SFN96129.1 Phage shock protein PspC (stress-responsive transcriptional regulator) [Saccharopolyspora antimicrobica]
MVDMSTTKRAGAAAFEDTMRDFWATRPVRPRSGGKVGGVSAAIALRYGIDPILVRVAFVLAAIYGGAGVVLYLLGWLLFPKESESLPGTAKPRPEPTSGTLAVILVLLLLPSVLWLISSPGIIGLAVGLGAFYLIHRSYGDCNAIPAAAAPMSAAPTTAPAPEATQVGENTWVYPGAEQTADVEQKSPPAWDPLGVAPFAWDLPEPSEPEPPEPQQPKRRWITWVTLGLAAFAGGLTSALGAPLYVALTFALGTIGIGLIIGSFLRGGRGLIAAAVPLAAAAMIASMMPLDTYSGEIGEHEVHPETADELAPDYQLSAGTITLDLRGMEIAEDQEITTAASVGVGDILVHVPEDVDITAQCKSELGDVQCLHSVASGGSADQTATDLGADGPGGGRLNLDLRVGMGSVEVTRG